MLNQFKKKIAKADHSSWPSQELLLLVVVIFLALVKGEHKKNKLQYFEIF